MPSVSITKLVNACLVVATGERTVLIDPGVFAWKDPRLDASALPSLDRIVITHGHPDHYSPDFVRELIVRSPDAAIETTPDVVETLANIGVAATTESVSYTAQFEAPHELTPMGTTTPNIGVHIAEVLTHPGDSHTFSETMPILAMPFSAPWGSMTAGVRKTIDLGPRFVVPTHDWNISVEGRKWLGGLAIASFESSDTTFVSLDDFETITLDV